jgi:hypothetical protein
MINDQSGSVTKENYMPDVIQLLLPRALRRCSESCEIGNRMTLSHVPFQLHIACNKNTYDKEGGFRE